MVSLKNVFSWFFFHHTFWDSLIEKLNTWDFEASSAG
jgi:hypothetical protein